MILQKKRFEGQMISLFRIVIYQLSNNLPFVIQYEVHLFFFLSSRRFFFVKSFCLLCLSFGGIVIHKGIFYLRFFYLCRLLLTE